MSLIPGGIKIELSELAHGTITALTHALQNLADELHTYNHPPVEVESMMGTFQPGSAGKRIEIPRDAGDWETSEGGIKHKWPYETSHHDHPTTADFLQCLTDAGIL